MENILIRNIIAYFGIYIFTTTAMTYAGLSLLGIRLERKKLFTVGALQALVVFVLWTLMAIFELPSLIQIPLLLTLYIIILALVGKVRIGVAIAAVLISEVFVIIGDTLSFMLASKVFKLTVQDILGNPLVQFGVGQLGLLVIYIVCTITYYTGFKVVDLSGKNIIPR